MSIPRLLIWLALTAPSVFAAGLVLDGPPFSASGLNIEWKAPINNWPSTLWIFKVAPQEFPSAVVSNLMAMGGFTKKDQTHIEGQPPFKDKRMMYFANKERTRHLGIFPPYGWLYYRDEKADIRGRERVKGVPGETEALELALQHLDRLGISQSDLVHKADGSGLEVFREEGTRGWFDKTKQEKVQEVNRRGVFFVRQIDGVSFTGRGEDGGFRISFVNEGKIADLDLRWRNLQRHRSRKVLTPAEMVERIQRGQAKISPLAVVNLQGAKKLTVDNAEPCYLGEDSETLQEFVYPFASMECTIDFEDGRKARTILKCPMLVDE